VKLLKRLGVELYHKTVKDLWMGLFGIAGP
jgi:hypothetical protein